MNKSFLFLLAAAMTLAACQKTEISAPSTEGAVLSATIEDVASTKTYMDADNNILWSEGDQVVAFMKSSYGSKYRLISSFAGKTYADFEPVSTGNGGNLSAGTEWDCNVVYYPYSDAVEGRKSGSDYVLSVTLPAEQNYAAGSFGNGSMAMVAVSENNNITFRNVLGGMKLQLKGTQKVASITLEGKNSEKLSGAATVTAYSGETKPAIVMSDDASTSVTLHCGSGVQLSESSATQFIIALPPVVFTKGFTVTITDTESNTYTVGTDKPNTVLRSSLLVMPAVSLESGQGSEPQEGDYIDEYGINHGQGIEIDGVVWAPVNCGYKKATEFSKGFPKGKLYQWGRKYGQGYSASANESEPLIQDAPVSLEVGQSEEASNIFYASWANGSGDWLVYQDDALWNAGDDNTPVKTEYDPCPEGWRVPTRLELYGLSESYSPWTTKDDDEGCWFSGSQPYSDDVAKVFLSTTGFRDSWDGVAGLLTSYSGYWTSEASSGGAYLLDVVKGYSSSTTLYVQHFGYNRARGAAVRCVKDERKELIPVESVTLDKTSLTLYIGGTRLLSASILPSNSNHRHPHWWSSNPNVAMIDADGNVTAISEGTAIITAVAGMQSSACSVTVLLPQEGDYIDEYGENHGPGIEINGVVWAPVNCGYKAASETDNGYQYGKLYQWGRKYGQGYDGLLWINGEAVDSHSDATFPQFQEGSVSAESGSNIDNAEIFFTATDETDCDWCETPDEKLWNSGWPSTPEKTEYDPCPEGWRVPSYWELEGLLSVESTWTYDASGQSGLWFGETASDADNAAKVFFPAAGYYNYDMGGRNTRGYDGFYWSCTRNGDVSYGLYFTEEYLDMNVGQCANGYSVRCVQE